MDDFGQAQLSGHRVTVLQSLVRAVGGERVHALEIGSYEGGSALAMAEVIAEYPQRGTVFCVDPWKPYLGKEVGNQVATEMDADLKSGKVFARFKRNILKARVPVCYFIGTIGDAFHQIKHRRFDLVFIDGCHLFDEVYSDLTIGSGLLRPGGILCGDDLEKQLPDCMPEELACEFEYNGHSHPGVTKAVWQFFGKRVWTQAEGVWAVRKTNRGWEDFDGA